MSGRVVLDTSYLISLADRKRAHHDAAREYWRSFIERRIQIYLPTIVVSEFYVKQEIDPGVLRSCILAPFNWDDARKAASLHTSIAKLRSRDEPRDSVKDDIKIIAQALVISARWIITDDSSSFYKLAFAAADLADTNPGNRLCPIKLEDGFDPSFFEPSRQRQLF